MEQKEAVEAHQKRQLRTEDEVEGYAATCWRPLVGSRVSVAQQFNDNNLICEDEVVV